MGIAQIGYCISYGSLGWIVWAIPNGVITGMSPEGRFIEDERKWYNQVGQTMMFVGILLGSFLAAPIAKYGRWRFIMICHCIVLTGLSV